MALKKAEYNSPGQPSKRGFEDLEFYRLSLDVVVFAHELARRLPPEEKYDMAAQIRRSSKAVTANIAEGYGRYHYLDSLRSYSIARGELNETLAHFINARVLGYIEPADFECVYHLIRQAEQALNGFMHYVRRQQAGQKEYGDRSVTEEYEEYQINNRMDE
jgi:four helix bundle protein